MTQSTQPTPEQDRKIQELQREGYTWNKQRSLSAVAVILDKGEDFWFFGLDGSIEHNPYGIKVHF